MNGLGLSKLEELELRIEALERIVLVMPHSKESPKDDEMFMEIWSAGPATRSDGKPARGNRAKAYRAYQKCVCQKYTPEILTEAAAQYLMSLPEDTQYIQQVATQTICVSTKNPRIHQRTAPRAFTASAPPSTKSGRSRRPVLDCG